MRRILRLLWLPLVSCSVPPAAHPPMPPSAAEVRALVDQFDRARLTGEAGARDALWQALRLPGPPERGEAATRRALEGLIRLADQAGLPVLRDLLDDDLDELEGRDPAAIGRHRRHEIVERHATLALYASCLRTLGDAATAPPGERAPLANRCLYALTDADPAPYLARDAARRPPDPPWSFHFAGLRALLASLEAASSANDWTRQLGAELSGFEERVACDGLAPPDWTRLGALLPRADDDLPAYDHEPWIIVEENLAAVGRARFTPHDHPLGEHIGRLLGRDAGTLALFIPRTARAEVAEALAARAKQSGARTIGLVLAAPIATPPPPGPPWGERPPDGRFVILPLAARADLSRERPRQLGGQAASFTLLVAPGDATLYGHDGTLALGAIADLADRLADFQRAFPDERQLALAIDPTASYQAVVETALALHRVFRHLIWVDIPKRVPGDRLAKRFQLRRRAVFRARLQSGAPLARVESLRGCYVEALESQPTLRGSLTVRPAKPIASSTSEPLAACLNERIAALALAEPLTLEFAPR